MKKILLSIIMAGLVFVASAQKTIVNDANAEKRSVGGFTGIRVSNAIDLYLTQGDEDGVAVSAKDIKYRDRIKTEVIDGILKIWIDNNSWSFLHTNLKLRAYVSVKSLTKLHVSGASDVYVNGVIKTTDIDVELSGASDFKEGVIEASSMNVHLSGASDMKIKGTAGSLKVHASGASDFKGFDFTCQNGDVEASGASDINVTVEKEINAHASGASDIRIKGNGVIKTMSNSGASSVKKI
jgi:hypothetical protein